MSKNVLSYKELFKSVKYQIVNSQNKAINLVNKELILLYWKIGNIILKNQEIQGWGSKIIENLSKDIKSEFPDLKGFSERNLKYMRKFAEEYNDIEFVQQVVAQIPWSHNVVVMEKIKHNEERIWYINKTVKNGWSRNVLLHQIETNLYKRQELNEKTTNYNERLIKPNDELAIETLKDPYIFDFITFREDMNERDIENQVVKKITKFLLELGSGFAFIGNQYHFQRCITVVLK